MTSETKTIGIVENGIVTNIILAVEAAAISSDGKKISWDDEEFIAPAGASFFGGECSIGQTVKKGKVVT